MESVHLGCCGGESDTDINGTAEKAVSTFPTSNGYLLNLTGNLAFPGGAAGNTTLGSPLAPHGTGATRGSNSPLWSFSDSFSWTQGKHSFKAGGEWIFANSDGWNTGNTDLYPRATLAEGSVAITGITTTAFPGLNTKRRDACEGSALDARGIGVGKSLRVSSSTAPPQRRSKIIRRRFEERVTSMRTTGRSSSKTTGGCPVHSR
jgi:hypothetical protein